MDSVNFLSKFYSLHRRVRGRGSASAAGFCPGGVGEALVVIVLMIVINGVTENIVAPMIMGRGLSISPTVVFLSFIFWMFILGGPGAFIAMPLTLAVILFMHSFEETHNLVEAVIIVEPVQKPARASSKA
jgi:predicted PurR-regulated permease PerM